LRPHVHELSIAASILEIVERSLPAETVVPVLRVSVRVGRLAGVVPDSLEFCFRAVTAGTRLDGAALVIESVPVTLRCGECGRTSVIEDIAFACPSCASPGVSLETGTELQVAEVEIADAPSGEQA
jgi:hydrogenase nickel incorporation protein HypA/HybF